MTDTPSPAPGAETPEMRFLRIEKKRVDAREDDRWGVLRASILREIRDAERTAAAQARERAFRQVCDEIDRDIEINYDWNSRESKALKITRDRIANAIQPPPAAQPRQPLPDDVHEFDGIHPGHRKRTEAEMDAMAETFRQQYRPAPPVELTNGDLRDPHLACPECRVYLSAYEMKHGHTCQKNAAPPVVRETGETNPLAAGLRELEKGNYHLDSGDNAVCRRCFKWAESPDEVEHAEDCPILALRRAINAPPAAAPRSERGEPSLSALEKRLVDLEVLAGDGMLNPSDALHGLAGLIGGLEARVERVEIRANEDRMRDTAALAKVSDELRKRLADLEAVFGQHERILTAHEKRLESRAAPSADLRERVETVARQAKETDDNLVAEMGERVRLREHVEQLWKDLDRATVRLNERVADLESAVTFNRQVDECSTKNLDAGYAGLANRVSALESRAAPSPVSPDGAEGSGDVVRIPRTLAHSILRAWRVHYPKFEMGSLVAKEIAALESALREGGK